MRQHSLVRPRAETFAATRGNGTDYYLIYERPALETARAFFMLIRGYNADITRESESRHADGIQDSHEGALRSPDRD